MKHLVIILGVGLMVSVGLAVSSRSGASANEGSGQLQNAPPPGACRIHVRPDVLAPGDGAMHWTLRNVDDGPDRSKGIVDGTLKANGGDGEWLVVESKRFGECWIPKAHVLFIQYPDKK